jgi:hypothetical protein
MGGNRAVAPSLSVAGDLPRAYGTPYPMPHPSHRRCRRGQLAQKWIVKLDDVPEGCCWAGVTEEGAPPDPRPSVLAPEHQRA